jgi:3-dehydroquinate synthetase
VHRAGRLPTLTNIDEKEVLEAFSSDKKHSAGFLQMVLLKGIGKPVIVAENDIPPLTIQKVLKKLLQEWA